MIVNSVEQFVRHVQDGWMGKKISVAKVNGHDCNRSENSNGLRQISSGCHCAPKITKTKSPAAIELKLDEVKVIPWEEVDRRIQNRYNEDSSFLLMGGKSSAGSAEGSGALLRNIIIHVDKETVFDVRDNRLVLLSDEEVIQFSAIH